VQAISIDSVTSSSLQLERGIDPFKNQLNKEKAVLRYLAIGVVTLLLFSNSAMAQSCTGSTWTTLTNGSPADATQVMNNFTCVLTNPRISGFMGVGSTGASWGGIYNHVIDIGSTGAVGATTNQSLGLLENMYFDGTNWIRKATGYANSFLLLGNGFSWYQAPSGSAGSIATSTNLMYLDPNGNLVILGCLIYNSGTLGTCISDARVKTNVKEFDTIGLAEINSLRPVTFSYNGLAGTPNDTESHAIREGLIAQEVQKIAPQLVSTTHRKLKPSDQAETALLEVDYGALTFGLINAVKELKAVNDNQGQKINKLEARLATLSQQVDEMQALRKRMSALERETFSRTAETPVAAN
jgi:hypothetical protein